MTVRDSGGNVQVDFVWGNFPLQPNDDRGENTLDASLDNHVIATTGYSNFPGFIPNYAGDGDVALETVVPKVTNTLQADAEAALVAAGLVVGTVTDVTVGATEKNNGKVATQSVAAGTVVDLETAVDLGVYLWD